MDILIPKEEIQIGPPLAETIRICNNKLTSNEVESIKKNFKEIYDNKLFVLLQVYENVELLLKYLRQIILKFLLVPTKKIYPYNENLEVSI